MNRPDVPTRRAFVGRLAALGALTTASAIPSTLKALAVPSNERWRPVHSPDDALTRLMEGNARFVHGAVKATLTGGEVPGQISSLYYHIMPAAEAAQGDVEMAVVQNVRNQARLLARSSPVLAGLVTAGTLRIVGGVFDLGTGVVTMVNV